MYSWLLGKINTDMHGKVAGIGNKNGNEFNRSIYISVDAVPANAELYYNQAFMQLVPMYAGKVENLTDLYGIRVVLEKYVSEYKQEIGK